MRIAIAAGGTAGHVHPALALAHALAGDEVTFIGTGRGLEARIVPQAGFPLAAIEVRGFDRAKPLSIVPTGATAVRAVVEARRALQDAAADAVVGMGGYVSLPACIAARSLRRPVVIHEQNIVFGLANRVCKPVAARVAVSFEETLAAAGSRGVLTGNPVLPHLVEADLAAARSRGRARFDLDPERATVIVFGGSQGARRVNEAARGLVSLWADRDDVQILHITGRSDAGAPPRSGGRLVYRAVPFVEAMLDAYAIADVAVCRGGATTIAELGVIGLPAVVVPYPYHRDRQQELHGRVLARAGAAVVIPDADATPARVAAELEAVLGDPDALARMRAAARSFGRPDAAATLAALVREVAA